MSLIPLPFWMMLPALCTLGAWVLGWLANRTTRNQQLRDILLASFWVRVGLAIALFVISYWHLPILQSLQFGDGLWTFAGDAQAYHAYGQTMSQSWWRGESAILPEARIFPYSFIVAVIYWFFGPHLLYGVLFNAWCGAVCGLLAYLIAGRAMGERARLSASVLVGFWPSSLIWSAQLLKDPLTWCLLLTALYLSVVWLQGSSSKSAQRSPAAWRAIRVSWFAAIVIVMTILRPYLGFAFGAAITLVAGGTLAMSLIRRDIRGTRALVQLVFTVALSVRFPSFIVWPAVEARLAAWQTYRMSHEAGQIDPGLSPQPSPGAVAPTPAPSDASGVKTKVGKVIARSVEGILAYTGLEILLEILLKVREGFLSTGGHSLMGREKASTPAALLGYLPQALMIALLAPFPYQWFDHSGSTGVMRLYSGVEMVVIYVLLLSILRGVWSTIRHRERGGLLLLIFTALLMATQALTITNLGTLFRLRLLFLFPLLIMAAGGGVLGPYQTVGRWLLRLVGNHHTDASDLHREGRRADSEDQLAAKS